ncbi:MAG: glycosyl hydrolase family 28-related protein, partial [Verrucomicrobiota bacterium]
MDENLVGIAAWKKAQADFNSSANGVLRALGKTGVTSVTGTPSSTTYLRGDGTWSSVAGAAGGTVTSVATSAPITGGPITGTGTIGISAATTSDPGSMSAADKTKLNGVATGATANLGTVTAVTGAGAISSTGGTTPEISVAAATTSVPGTMSATDKAKLDRLVSILDFSGADPTGAADSTSAFLTALATGKDIFVPRGTYQITGSLHLHSNQSIRGEPGALLTGTLAGYVFENRGAAAETTAHANAAIALLDDHFHMAD